MLVVMAIATLPPPVDIDNDTKKAIIEGLKRVLSVFQDQGFLDSAVAYQDLIAEPHVLIEFIQAFFAHRAVVDDVVRGRDDAPVRDDDQPLTCGVSINQVQQLLVRTCAKKVFEHDKPVETVTETVTKTSFLFFKKTEHVEVLRAANDPVEERKVREITRYTAFGWQLPLLEAYRHCLTYQQIMEIAEDLVALTTEDNIIAVGQFDPAVLKKVKQVTGADFPVILAHRPQAIAGIAVWSRDMYEFYRRLLGEAAWEFFARETAFFNVVAALDKATAKVFGDVLCYIAGENLQEFQRINIDKSEVLVMSLRAAFGDKLPLLLSVPSFGKDILRKVVDNILHTNQEKDKLIISFGITCKAMAPSVLDWLARQQR